MRRAVRLPLTVAALAVVALTVVALTVVARAHHAVPPRSTDPATLILRVRTVIGMPSPHIAEIPEFSLYGDGRLLRPGTTAGTLQTIEELHLDAGDVDRIYRAAHRAGLDRDGRYEDNSAVDAGLLITTLRSGDRTYVIQAVEGGQSGGPVGRIERFRATLRPDALRKDPASGGPPPYRPERLAAVAWGGGTVTPMPSDGPASTGAASSFPPPGADVRPWPFAPLATATRINEGLCVPLSGADLTAAERLARQATPATLWRSGTSVLHVVFRPLLPDERSCADIDWH